MRGGFQNANHGRRNYGDQGQPARQQPTTETVTVSIIMDYNIEERRHLIMSEKRWDNKLTRGTNANDVRCGGGERINITNADDATYGRQTPPGDGDGNGRRQQVAQALGGLWHRIRWRRKRDFAGDNNMMRKWDNIILAIRVS